MFARKKKGRGGGRRLSRNWGLPYYTEVFLEIPHDAAYGKNLDVFIFSLSTNMCYKTTAQIRYEMIGFVMVLIVLI